jgi:hypothetical protein
MENSRHERKKLPLCSTYAKRKGKKREPATNQNPLPRQLFLNAIASKFTPYGDDFAMFIPREAMDLVA